MTDPRTVAAVFRELARRPWQMVGRRWNHKAALLSALVRAAIFFATNTTAGLDAARAAALTEMMLRLATSGFYGALTQAFRRVEPAWTGTLAAVVVLPCLAHSLELVVHVLAGTPSLGVSIGASVAFTMLSTTFNLFAMRHGTFIVGEGSASLGADLLALPRLLGLFVRDAARSFARACL